MFACAQLLCFTPNCNLLIWSSVNTKVSMTSSASSASWRGGSAQMPPSLISCRQKTEGQWIDNSVGWQVKQRGGSFLSSLPFHWYRISLVKFSSSVSVSFLRWESRVWVSERWKERLSIDTLCSVHLACGTAGAMKCSLCEFPMNC